MIYFRTIRKTTANVKLSDKALIIQRLLGILKDEYDFNEIKSYYFFKVAFILPYGVGFNLSNGKRVEFAPPIIKMSKWKSALSESGILQVK